MDSISNLLHSTVNAPRMGISNPACKLVALITCVQTAIFAASTYSIVSYGAPLIAVILPASPLVTGVLAILSATICIVALIILYRSKNSSQAINPEQRSQIEPTIENQVSPRVTEDPQDLERRIERGELIDGKIANIEISSIKSLRLVKILSRYGYGDYLCKIKNNDGTINHIHINRLAYGSFLDHLPKEKIVEKINRYENLNLIGTNEATDLQTKIDPVDGKIGGLDLSSIQSFEVKKSLFFEDAIYCLININGEVKKVVMPVTYFKAFGCHLPEGKLSQFALQQFKLLKALEDCDLAQIDNIQTGETKDGIIECHIKMNDDSVKIVPIEKTSYNNFMAQVPTSMQGGHVQRKGDTPLLGAVNPGLFGAINPGLGANIDITSFL
jgi:hypothetical protein